MTRSSLSLLEDFQMVNERPTATARCCKVNVDGVVFSKRKQAGVGVVIAALCRKLYTLLGPLETEAKAMEIGVTFTMEVRVRDVTFEGDLPVI
ncbi:hypothetical protein CFP56_030395 [Quercus suber]|uniref:RNase H type-1 domain-containing protein n=1 Tax=Quercus suber TaxID=58331 RepID=A0AAW0JNZ1_QUESU